MASKKQVAGQVVDDAIRELQKKFGHDRVVARLGDAGVVAVDAAPTGIYSLDRALGCGGFPRGRISETFGPEAGGKSTLMLHTIAQVQAGGGEALYADAENRFDPAYAEALGVDTKGLILVQGGAGEQILEIVDSMIETGGLALAVIDSAAALVPRAELEGEMDDNQMGLQARLLGKACRKMSDSVAKSNTALVFVNQVREKVGIVFGNPEVTPGGKALKFWSTVRVDIRRATFIKEGDLKVGIRARAKVVKNSVAPPFQETEFDIYSGLCRCHAKGVDRAADLLDAAVVSGAVEKAGAWFSFDGERIGQGRLQAADSLRNPKLAEKILKVMAGA